jgi:hypothetical protein
MKNIMTYNLEVVKTRLEGADSLTLLNGVDVIINFDE